MTDTKFTPGPWLLMDYNADETFPRWCVVPKSCIGTIAHVQVSEANANLIAAAPDLYGALERAEYTLRQYGMRPEFYREASSEARAALAKARGEQ